MLKTLCRISLSPDSCVRQTESIFERYGMPSLLLAKFIPGFSTVAPPLAGAVGASLPVFLLYDSGGDALWAGAGSWPACSSTARSTQVLAFLAGLGSGALVLLGAALALFVSLKWWQRRRFYKDPPHGANHASRSCASLIETGQRARRRRRAHAGARTYATRGGSRRAS